VVSGGILILFYAWAGSAPRSKSLPYHVPFLTEKAPLSIVEENENLFTFL